MNWLEREITVHLYIIYVLLVSYLLKITVQVIKTTKLILISNVQIRRMQDMLMQMQEKLKATGQTGNERDSIVNV